MNQLVSRIKEKKTEKTFYRICEKKEIAHQTNTILGELKNKKILFY